MEFNKKKLTGIFVHTHTHEATVKMAKYDHYKKELNFVDLIFMFMNANNVSSMRIFVGHTIDVYMPGRLFRSDIVWGFDLDKECLSVYKRARDNRLHNLLCQRM